MILTITDDNGIVLEERIIVDEMEQADMQQIAYAICGMCEINWNTVETEEEKRELLADWRAGK